MFPLNLPNLLTLFRILLVPGGQMLDGGERFVLLDCREPDEVAAARIAGSTHIPMREISARLGEIQPHHAERIVVHCHHGGRSLRVANWLRDQGFSQAQSLAGGIDAWAAEIDPSLPRY